MTDAGCNKIYEALALSLISVRPIHMKKYPAKYESALSDAEATFKNGSPAKGCSLIYDEIEGLSRAIAKKSKAKGYWRSPRQGQRVPRTNLDIAPWQNVMEVLMERLDWQRCKCLKNSLQRVVGVVPHRNESGHKPKTLAARIKRDSELRTRFEAAADLLFDLICACRPLHL